MNLTGFYNMDCMEGMKEIPDETIDLIITSPPYNLGKEHHTGNNRFKPYKDDVPELEYQNWQLQILKECYRVLKGDGSMFYNHKNRIKLGKQITPYEWILKSPFIVKQELVWFNRSQNFDKIRFYPMTERIYWLSKSVETKFSNKINHHDLFNWEAEGAEKDHKRAFPLKMVKDFLSCFPTGLKVLEPFAGSGTTLIACEDLGFEYLGFELDEDYYKQAVKRIEEFRNQTKLF